MKLDSAMIAQGIPKAVANRIGYYVYMYVDPRTDRPFYIGKGKGSRILAHLGVNGACGKGDTLREIREAGLEPILTFVAHNLDEEQAFLIESVLIDHMGLDRLSNKVRGHHAATRGLMSFEQLVAMHASAPLEIDRAVLMIRLPRTFRYDMSAEALFEATCGTWKIGQRRDEVELVLAVHDEVVQEVYRVDRWQPGGTHRYRTRDVGGVSATRWEFVGAPVDDAPTRERYLHRHVGALFPRGAQNPLRYACPREAQAASDERPRRAA